MRPVDADRLGADEALARLKAGNRRFVDGTTKVDAEAAAAERDALVAGQAPFAIVLGCSDARVPAEIVFDQGLGDLFVIRVAGNIAAPSQVGSIEYAATMFGARLVVVMGHSHCGAIAAAVDEISHLTSLDSPNLLAIVERIMPTIETLTGANSSQDRASLEAAAVRANVHATVSRIRQSSQVLSALAEQDGLRIVGAEYDLGSGAVTFLDDPDPGR